MPTSWADSVAADAAPVAGASGYASNGVIGNASGPGRSTYVPPHLRNKTVSPGPPGPAPHAIASTVSPLNDRAGGQGDFPQGGGHRWNGPRHGGVPAGGAGRGSGSGSGWNNRSGGWGGRPKEREVNPFEEDDNSEQMFGDQENTGINFDAYEDIPVETSGDNVPAPVNTFLEIDLGEALNQNIKRCKYVRPTPVQKYAIPISLAGRDLMACAQTGSGKTAAFCFPIISGIMRGQYGQRPPRVPRMAFPLALILSPTRELSCQVVSGLVTYMMLFYLWCFILVDLLL